MLILARYDLRLTPAEFGRLTPRQFTALLDRHHAALAHAELCHGYTTAAVINWSQFPPKEPASAMDFMPHHREHKPPSTNETADLTDEQLERLSDYNVRVAELAAKLIRGKDTDDPWASTTN